jgi:hypothetical protein
VQLQVTFPGELGVGVHHDRTGHTELAGEIAGGGESGTRAEGQVPDRLAELVLDLLAEGAGALPGY